MESQQYDPQAIQVLNLQQSPSRRRKRPPPDALVAVKLGNTVPGSPRSQTIENTPASASATSSNLLQKVESLQAVLKLLVSRPESTSEEQSEIEKMVDQVMVEARGFLMRREEEDQQHKQQPVQASGINCSSGAGIETATVAVGSNNSSGTFGERFGLECLDFSPPPLGNTNTKAEDGNQDEFLSYFAEIEGIQVNMGSSSYQINGDVFSAFGAAGLKDEDDEALEAEALPPGSYDLLELDAMEILAEHTHFCEICGKGFKRDANLRMHMRGHGDEYKTAAALSKPKDLSVTEQKVADVPKRYSCPFESCKRHKLHPKFFPLKTVLCVKNHYRRSHCPKMLTCSKCNSKKFSVMADLRTHEKHCGREKWQCSCGSTFSRKDKLLGHVALFVGHRPLLPAPNCSSSSSFSRRVNPAAAAPVPTYIVDDQADQSGWTVVVFPDELKHG